MKKVFGLSPKLLGLIAVATFLAPGPNPIPNNVSPDNLPNRFLQAALSPFPAHANETGQRNQSSRAKADDGGVTWVYVLPALREQKAIKQPADLHLQSSPRPAITRAFAETSKLQLAMPPWLSELNQWRRMAGLHVIAENPRLSYGSEEHARYLVVQGPADSTGFRSYDRSIGPAAHFENSQSPIYTTAGAQAAIGGPLTADIIQGADVAWEGRSESGDIDNLIVAPFHRLSLLAPWARIGGYGSFGEYPRRAAALALRGPLESQLPGHPVEFPPANTNVSINRLSGSEWPNPIAPCAGYVRPVGLPITLQIGRRLLLQSYKLHDQTSDNMVEACGIDALTYRNPDAIQEKRGRELLKAYGAIVLIPRKPLILGHQYQVTVRTFQGDFEWSFGLTGNSESTKAESGSVTIAQVANRR